MSPKPSVVKRNTVLVTVTTICCKPQTSRNLQVIDEEHFFELDGNLYKVMDPKALVEVSRVRPKKQANAEQRKLSGFKQWYANRRGVF